MKEDTIVERAEVEKAQLIKLEQESNPIEWLIYTIFVAILVGAFFEYEEYQYELALILIILVLIYIIIYQYRKLILYEKQKKTKNIKIII